MHGKSQQVSRGLNTIAGRVAKNSDALKKYGVSVNDSNGNLRSTYDILGDLKPKWDKMSNAEKVSLGNTLAGVNQYKVFAAVMGNYGKAQEATTTALNSSGSAAKENKKQIESLQGKINELKAAFAELVLGDGGVIDLVKGIIDAGTAILKFANSDVGGAIIKTGLLAVSFALISTKVLGAVSALSTLNKALKTLGIIGTIKNWNNLAGAIAEVGVVSTTVEGAVGGTAAAATGASAAFAGLLTTLAPFLIGGAAILGFYELYKYVLSTNAQLKRAQNELDNTNSKIQKNASAIEKAKSKEKTLTSEIQELENKKNKSKADETKLSDLKKQKSILDAQLVDLKKQTSELEKQQKIREKQVVRKNIDNAVEDYSTTSGGVKFSGASAISISTSKIEDNTKVIEKGIQAQKDYKKAKDKLDASYSNHKSDDYKNALKKLNSTYGDTIAKEGSASKTNQKYLNSLSPVISAYNKAFKNKTKLTDADKENVSMIAKSIKANYRVTGSITPAQKAFYNYAKKVGLVNGKIDDFNNKKVKDHKPNVDKNKDAWSKLGDKIGDAVSKLFNWNNTKVKNKVGNLTIHTQVTKTGLKINSNTQDWTNGLTVTGKSAEGGESSGGITLVNEEGAELIDTGDSAYVAGGGQPTLVNLKKGDYVYTANESAGMGVTSNGSYRTRKKGTSKSKAKSKASKTLDNLSYQLDMDLISEKSYYSKLAKLNKKYHKRKLIDSDTYKDNLKSIHDYQNELVKDNLDKKLDALATESGYTTKNQKNYLAYLKKLKKQHKISTEEYKEYYQQYNKTVADHYADAYKDGTMTYDQLMTKLKAFVKAGKITWADYYSYVDDANEEAKEKYEDALNDQQNKLDVQQTVMEWYADQQKKVIENQITALENEKQLIEDEKSATDEAEQLAELQQNLIDAQNTKIRVFQDGEWKYVQNANSVKEAQDALNDFSEEQAYNKRIEAIDNQIDALQDESDAWDTYVSNYEDLQTKLLNEQTLGMTYEQYIQNSRITNLETFNAAFEKLVNEQIAIAQKLKDAENGTSTTKQYIVLDGAHKGEIVSFLSSAKIHNGQRIPTLGHVMLLSDYEAKNSTSKGFAVGSNAIPVGGTYRFNENGDELSIPPNLNYAPAGTGIIPHTMTENLKEIGMHSWGEIERGVSNSDNHSVNINSMTVKTDDPRDFLRQMKNLVNINN
jgi:hypothetical protein